MTRLRMAVARLIAFFGKRRREAELNDEIQAHLDLLIDEQVRRGVSLEDARAAARREFGGVEQIKETYRDQRGLPLVDELVQDLRYGWRMLRKDPAFTIVVVATLAIGIGTTSVAFTQLNAVFWKPLPGRNPGALRILSWTSPTLSSPSQSFSYDAYLMLRDRIPAADIACGWRSRNSIAEWGPITFELVTGNYFRTLGVDATLGRMLTPEDDRPGGALFVAVISARLWRRAYGGNPDVIGRTVPLNGTPFQIVGVMPEGFAGLNPADPREVMLPYGTASSLGAAPQRDQKSWRACREVVARLGPGVSDEQVRAEGQSVLTQAMLTGRPPNGNDARFLITDMRGSSGPSTLRKQTSQSLFLLIAAASLILLSTCANIAGLLFARGRARQRELATRLSVGAPRARIVRQLLTESLLLSAVGGALGMALAYVGSPLLPDLLGELSGRNWLNPTLTPGVNLTPDLRVLVFAISLTVVTGVVFGLAPAVRTTGVDLVSMMKQLPGTGARRVRFRTGNVLVSVQVALSMLLLIGAGLFVRTLLNLMAVPVGYDSHGLVFVEVDPRGSPQGFIRDTLRRFEDLPGITSATFSQWPIYNNAEPKLPVCVPNYGDYGMDVEPVGPRFFETWGVRFVLGRDFGPFDQDRRSVIVNQIFVKKFFGNENPIGREVGFGKCPGARRTIVGVVADHLDRPRVDITPMVYIPYPFSGTTPVATFAVRSSGDSELLVEPVRRLMAETGAHVDGDVMTGLSYKEREWRKERMLSGFLLFFGALALVISCMGVYGVLAYSVSSRTSELGIRMALGAQRVAVIRMILAESVMPVAVGIVLGMAAALMLTRWMESLLFGVSKHDPWTIAAAATLLILTAAAAAFVPARRASRIDPMVALRYE